jgi:uncharacterized membrane protein
MWKLAVLGIIAYQVLLHFWVAGSAFDPMRAGLVMLPMVALGCWILLRSDHRAWWLGIVAGAAGAAFLLAHGTDAGMAALYGVPHAVAYVFLLCLFGRTLARGREPLITRLARHTHGTLSPDMTRYTRRLTLAWCVFFAAQLATSALLLRFASIESWSLFINVLNFPLLGLMFAADYLYRMIRYRDSPQASIATAVQAYAKDRASSLLPR